MRALFCGILLFTGLLSSSCFVRTNRVSFASSVPLVSKYYEFNKDSIRFVFEVKPNTKNMVIPFMIFKGNKKKAKISFGLHGKGISSREYSVTYKNMFIKSDTVTIGKSNDPNLFIDEIQRPPAADGISPVYATGYVLLMEVPARKNGGVPLGAKKMNLNYHLEFEVKNRAGLAENFIFDLPMQRTIVKKYSLFNPFK